MELEILFEDDYIVVAVKPDKVPSQKDLSGDLDMVTAISEHIKKRSKKDEAYVGLVHRLDRPVSGIMVFAKTAKANALLSEQIRLNKMSKRYRVVVCGHPKESKVTLTDLLIKQSNNLSKVVSADIKEAKQAVLHYECLKIIAREEYGELSLLNVELITGRHHQIRVQLAHANLPIWGDTKYNKRFLIEKDGNSKKAWYQIALCANQLSFAHPKTGKDLIFKIEPSHYPFDQFNLTN